MGTKEMIHIELNAIEAYKNGKTTLDNPFCSNSHKEQHELWNETFNIYKDHVTKEEEQYVSSR